MEENGPLILIVEDNEFMRSVLTRVLRGQNHISAKCGSEALKIFTESKPKIVFLDLILPDVSGFILMKMIKKIDPRSFIVIVSSESSKEAFHKAVALGANGYIIKPYSKAQIDKYIEKYNKDNIFDELF